MAENSSNMGPNPNRKVDVNPIGQISAKPNRNIKNAPKWSEDVSLHTPNLALNKTLNDQMTHEPILMDERHKDSMAKKINELKESLR